MNFFKPRLSGNRSGRMLVKWAEVTSKLKLLADVEFLVAED